jgi:hypothetical protein
MTIPPGFVNAVLSNDPYPLRFEAFVVDLLSAAEGEVFLPTSRTHDRGRDARALRGSDLAQHILAVTTSKSLESKTIDDVRRVRSTTKLASYTYCTSQELTETAVDGISAELRKQLPTEVSLRVLGLTQIRELASRNENVLRKHYRADLDDLRQALQYEPDTQEALSVTGLRLALQTYTGDDAAELRKDICRRLVLEQMLDDAPRSGNTIAVGLSGRLHLPRTISPSFLSPILVGLVTDGLIEEHGDKFLITARGRAAATDIGDTAAGRLLEGKQAVREALTHLLGYGLAEPDYERFWAVFRDTLAELFYLHGASIVTMVSSLQTGEASDDESAFRVARERLADRAAAVFSNHEQQSEMRQAVIDLLSQKGTKAFDWLTSICSVYVMMCAIGLESLSAQEVSRVLRGIILAPDTDILISLICEDESNHEEVMRIVTGWRSLGGDIRAPTPALEEVAYHAWIADNDYVAVRDMLPTLGDERAEYLIANAFVRTFRKRAKDLLNPRQWNQFIGEFRGSSPFDYSSILEILRGDLGIESLGDAVSQTDAAADPFFVSARLFLLEQAAAESDRATDELDDRFQDKVRRDAILLSSLKLLRERLRKTSNLKTAVIVSTARALRRAATKFRADLGRPEAVVTAAAIAALLALTPGVQMGVRSLKALLFDVKLAKRLRPAELFAYRLLERSDQYQLPLSRRVTYTRRLRERLIEEAQRTGKRPEEEERSLLQVNQPDQAAQILKDTLDRMAVPSTAVTTLRDQQRQIDELQATIERLRAIG